MIGQTVSHYKIIEKLGGGGMGVVYKAQDLKLDRSVALKFLPPGVTRDPEAKTRFVHEAKAASALQHNNICVVHDIDETTDGQMFISMEYLEGETLKKKIERGPLRIEEAINTAVQVAQGLTKAHEYQIIHRDIKPANVMVTPDGVAKIVDFGLAKLAGQARLTRTGSTIGTIAYMSPEQALGGDVDSNTDIWSLGVILFEMLTGHLPFRGEHEAALLYSVVHENPQSISNFRSDVPRAVVSVIGKALEKDPRRRYQSARELMSDLKSSVAPSAERPKPEKSIVVLPFQNLSPDPDQNYFCDGLTEELITKLSKVLSLRVISRTSAFTFKGSNKNIRDIARELNVGYLLEGSVRKAGIKLKITAQLIDAAADAHCWADTYDGILDDVFDIQEKVGRAVVSALQVKLTAPEDRQLAKWPISNADAYGYYLRARDVMYRDFSADGIDEAIRCLEAGLRITGENALLLATLANVYFQGVRVWVKEEAELEIAEEYAQKALTLDPEIASAHVVLGFVRWLQGRPQEFSRLVRQAWSIDPNDGDTVMWVFWLFIMAGRTSRALDVARHMTDLDPVHPYRFFYPAVVHAFEGRFGRAVEDLRSQCPASLLEQPTWLSWLAPWLVYAGCVSEAIEVLEPIETLTAGNFYVQFPRLLRFALKGERDRVNEVANARFREAAKRDCIVCCFVSGIYVILGDREQALCWVETAVNHGFINYPYLSEYDPLLAKIRDEPRYKKLMERVKKEWEEFEVSS